MWVDPREIFWPLVRITSQYREGEREALGRSLDAKGQQQTIGVFRVNGKYEGSDGYNRCMDAIEKGKPKVLCLVRQGSSQDVLLSNIATSLNRGHTNPLEVVETLQQAHEEEGVEVEELADSAGKSVEWVERMLQIAQASPAVRQMLGEDRITLGVAELLSDIDDQGEQERELHLVLQNRWTVAELREQLESAPGDPPAAPETRRGPAVRSPGVCTICHTEQKHGTIQTMHVCDGCAAKLGRPDEELPAAAAGGGPALEGLVAKMRAATPDLRRARELLIRMPGGQVLAENLGALAELLDGGGA